MRTFARGVACAATLIASGLALTATAAADGGFAQDAERVNASISLPGPIYLVISNGPATTLDRAAGVAAVTPDLAG